MIQGIRVPGRFIFSSCFFSLPSLLPALCRLNRFYYLLLKKKKNNPGSDVMLKEKEDKD